MPKEPTNAQLSSRLSYAQHTPAFLLKLQNKISGNRSPTPSDEEGGLDEFGRERRPAIPTRPGPGSGDEDNKDGDGEEDEDERFEDERPVVVVLKEGKHLSQREVENAKRKEKGLPPLVDPTDALNNPASSSTEPSSKTKAKTQQEGLSFSSSSGPKGGKGAKKRKVITADSDSDGGGGGTKEKAKEKPKKKVKKAKGGALLSFGDDV